MITIERILCPVDFSDFSRRAFDHTVAISRRFGSSITALHVVTPPPSAAPYVSPRPVQPFSLTEIDRNRLQAELRHFVAQETPAELDVEIRVEDGLQVAREILVQAQRLAADLIVIGTHGRSGFERLFLGSVAERVLRKASCPVMTVPPRIPDAVPRGPALFRRILCPVDFSRSSATALRYAMSLIEGADAQLTVMHVVELLPDLTEPPLSPRSDAGRLVESSRRRIEALVPDSFGQHATVVEEVSVGKAYREILRCAELQGSDLIVIGVQDRGAVDALLYGSTAQHVVRAARCPVLTLRPAGDESRRASRRKGTTYPRPAILA